GIRTNLVERATQKQLVARHAGEIERRGRHQKHFVARTGEIELLLAAVLEVADDRLLRTPEVGDRVADSLDLPPKRRRFGRPDDDARNPTIDLRFAERLHKGPNRRR